MICYNSKSNDLCITQEKLQGETRSVYEYIITVDITSTTNVILLTDSVTHQITVNKSH